MNMKSTIDFEITKNDRVYRFNIPAGAPYGETYDAIFTFLEKILDQQKASIQSLKEQNANTPAPSEGN
jgi:hypothetical protein